MTPDQFAEWLDDPRLGQQVEYYRGFLGHDRFKPFPKRLALRDRPGAIADRAMRAWLEGQVHLVQLWMGRMDRSYLAFRKLK